MRPRRLFTARAYTVRPRHGETDTRTLGHVLDVARVMPALFFYDGQLFALDRR